MPEWSSSNKNKLLVCIWKDMRVFMLGCAEWEQLCAAYLQLYYNDHSYSEFYHKVCDVQGDLDSKGLIQLVHLLETQHIISCRAIRRHLLSNDHDSADTTDTSDLTSLHLSLA